MIRYAIRRALWAIPTLFGVSLVVFFLTTLMPDPGGDLAASAASLEDPRGYLDLEDRRRSRFLDLPRFMNVKPKDVRSRAEESVAHITANDAEAKVAAERLARLGGAALPHVVPQLDNLSPAARGRVAVALAPIAERMSVGDPVKLRNPDQAARFWDQFWTDRSLDFTEPAVHRAVTRLADRGTDLRERDLAFVDTFALKEAIATMKKTRDPAALARLTHVAAHATGFDRAPLGAGIPREIDGAADRETAHAAVLAWQSWWYVHERDYVVLEGAEKVAASIGDTRYGKWMLGAATGQLGLSTRDGEPIFEKLRARAPITLVMTTLAMLLSFALAIPIGAISAWRRGTAIDTTMGVVLFAMYSLPTFWAAELFFAAAPRFGLSPGSGTELSFRVLALPTAALALASLAVLSRQQRAAMLEVIGQDYIRAARAKGLSTFRVVVVHALRNAMMPILTLAGLQFPTLLGGAFVVEEVFGIRGIGWETLRAIEAQDAAWLVATVLLTAFVTTVMLIVSDVAYSVLDPRVRESQIRRQGARA